MWPFRQTEHADGQNLKEIRIDAPIVPSLSAAGLSIGDDLHSIRLANVRPRRRFGEIAMYEIGPVTIWLKAGIVDQIGVGKGYQGRLFDRLMIGSTIAEVEEFCGARVEEDEEDNLVIVGVDGLCFETEAWRSDRTLLENKNARISSWFVSRA